MTERGDGEALRSAHEELERAKRWGANPYLDQFQLAALEACAARALDPMSPDTRQIAIDLVATWENDSPLDGMARQLRDALERDRRALAPGPREDGR